MSHCTQPDCTGSIEDGYCDLCGHAAQQPPPANAPAPGGASPPGSAPLSSPGSHPAPSRAPSGPAPSRAPSGPAPSSSPVTIPSGGRGPGSTPSRGTRGTGGSRPGLLGTGLAEVPPVVYRDPVTVVLKDPQVPEEKRFCSRSDCGRPVGRSRDGRPGRTEGFCPHDGTRFSFTPKLREGDLVAGQYEVKGCLAHGGLGWVYLAADRNLDGRWVVLKGLLNTADAEALAIAEAERRFLTGVDHANIVKIFNFVRHREPGAEAGRMAGYLVMEYIGGESLHDQLRRRLRESGGRDALPLRQAIPYALEILRAFAYLHERGMLYCDLKPANVIQVGRELKLIDLGAVRMASDQDSAIYGTVGYQAPEIASHGPSVASDLYTVGRTLAVLSFPFSPVRGGAEAPLPGLGDLPEQVAHESFHRFLRRATDPSPATRFSSAEEMADQLLGVLREVRAAEDGVPYPSPSALFGPERIAAGTVLAPRGGGRILQPPGGAAVAAALPVPLADPADPATAFLSGLTARTPGELVAMLGSAPETPETLLALTRMSAEQGAAEADGLLARAAGELAGDWRVLWCRGVHELVSGDLAEAVRIFDRCYGLMPGECAPRLALAFCLERAGNPAEAMWLYRTVWRTDRSYVSAAFGLARTLLAIGEPDIAVAALDEVPPSSSHFVAARLAAVAVAVRERPLPSLDAAALAGTGERLADLDGLDPRRRAEMAAEVLETALGWLGSGAGSAPAPGSGRGAVSGRLLGAPFTERGLRRELERLYRGLARSAATSAERHELIDRANATRPRTLL
ncbi:serine/threonine-protein kinase [Planomonospora venezuelensis]|uniref:non-specific serine/threonine protein kinase n=1 Tax=Planomonospora venezuelensis TaxID=1999 RepID=A0A841D4A7_PLAVE|nr:serine/threonine-protein kinase [Planomonospora venezuelensis]MBB5964660.1 serine/threonine-protein kinase PknG [Planomonospora venezuelensis]GIN03068.1 putative serine/threonine-protein kinase [Planomonospora venezuelensis]